MFSKKYFFIGGFMGIVLLIAYIFSLGDGKLQIVFCDVGQGDAAYIRTPNGADILIDGGPNNRVLLCLGNNMPFYDKNLELIVLSHPEKDHLQGLIAVLDRYSVDNFVIGVEGNESAGFSQLAEKIKEKNIPYKNLYAGDSFSMGEVRFNVLWPERKWAMEKVQSSKFKVQSLNQEGGYVLGLSTEEELNSFSYYLHLKYNNFDALFTGDGDIQIQPNVMKITAVPDVELLKFPHHGSKRGILPQFLDRISPELAVISVGKNSYGHPTKEALELLRKKNIIIKRTDLDGEVTVVSDGINWSYQN